MSKCVFILEILKASVTLLHFGGVHAAKKGWLQVIFSELGFTGFGARKTYAFDRKNQIIPWQGVYFFTNTVLQKS